MGAVDSVDTGDPDTDHPDSLPGDTDTSDPVDTSPDDTGPPPDPELAAAQYASLFDPTVLHTFELELNETGLAELASDPTDYVPAALTIDGTEVGTVGIRWHGHSDQWSWEAKPGFRIKVHEYDLGSRYAGLDALVLDNQEDDAAQARSVVAAQVMAGLGRAVPACSYAALTVNGESFGLYTNVEVVDATFVGRHFPDATGTLWEGNDDADLAADALDAWNAISGDSDTTNLQSVITALGTSGSPLADAVGTWVDLDDFAAHWAALAAVGHRQSWPYDLGNIYLYADPGEAGAFRFIPWNVDEGWDPEFGWNYVQSTIATRCLYDEDCVGRVRGAVDDALLAVDGMDVDTLLADAYDLSADAVADDPRRASSAKDVATARRDMEAAVTAWTTTVRGQLDE